MMVNPARKEEVEPVEAVKEEKGLSSDEEIQKAFSIVIDKLSEYRRIPGATYRLQFNNQFKFSDAKNIVFYLHELGISDIYASPYFKARKESLHGYDILDHNQLNPEVGTTTEYDQLVEELRAHGMGQVLDIVPNHMSIASDENQWWTDVLENGPSSIYAGFFDIDWKPVKDELENKVLLPILGDQYGNVLENQELRLGFEQGAFFINYYDRKLPVAPASYTKILKYAIEELEGKVGKEDLHFQEFLSVLTALDHLPLRTEKEDEKIEERRREKEVIKRRLQNLYVESQEIRSFIDRSVLIFNGEKGTPRSFELLDNLLNDQVYRLSHWRVAMEEINYRRFFDINELAAIRMENPAVFRLAHQLIFKLIREGKVLGLRVDHVDGVYNPAEYLYRLQKSCFIQLCLRVLPTFTNESSLEEMDRFYDQEVSKNSSLRMPLYVVGEKILIRGERMPEGWPLFGTTGYGFLNSLNGIFIEMENAKAFEGTYSRFIRLKINYQDLVYEKKKLIMEVSMSGEVNGLGHYLNRLSEKNRHTRDFTLRSLTTAIVETIACFPVYRSYVGPDGVDERDRRYIEQAVSRAKRKNPAMSDTIFDFLQRVLLLQYPDNFQEVDQMEWLDFVMRFQQVTGPVMAKGLEDTVFYIYNRFVSLNEVGGNPEWFGTPLETFHGQNIERAKSWPHSLLATSTHDTKRSEDVRARINVLSEIPDEWREHVTRWARINSKHKTMVDGQWAPDRNEEYLLYQTLVGAWPIHSMSQAEYEVLRQRMKDYMIKATREAKVNTSWISPNLLYEEGLLKFIESVLSPSLHNHFLWDLETFQRKISRFGMFNSLSQTLLKITSPGVPDFYQGTEIWNFSLVDPDNRRPVDYSVRKALLQGLKRKMESYGPDRSGFHQELLQDWADGSIKLYVTSKALNFRKANQELFLEGGYLPLASEGDLREHVCAFARVREGKSIIVMVPRFLTRLVKAGEDPLGEEVWKGSWIVIPEETAGDQFRNVFTDEMIGMKLQDGRRGIALAEVFKRFPVAMLESIGESK
jgi:(1->4)-alpha-D-glucan 1-alpha-D-glucosylmutase